MSLLAGISGFGEAAGLLAEIGRDIREKRRSSHAQEIMDAIESDPSGVFFQLFHGDMRRPEGAAAGTLANTKHLWQNDHGGISLDRSSTRELLKFLVRLADYRLPVDLES